MIRLYVVFAVGLMLACSAPASGQTAESAEVGPLVVPFVQDGAPQRLTGGLSILFPIGKTHREEGALVARGILLTATRSTDNPRGAFPESTYVGVEAGIALITPLNEYVSHRFGVMIKPSVGFAHRLDGPDGLKRTMFTWSVGAHIPTDFLTF